MSAHYTGQASTLQKELFFPAFLPERSVGFVPCLAIVFDSDNGVLSILGRLVLLVACRRDGLSLAVTSNALARIRDMGDHNRRRCF